MSNPNFQRAVDFDRNHAKRLITYMNPNETFVNDAYCDNLYI